MVSCAEQQERLRKDADLLLGLAKVQRAERAAWLSWP